MGSSSPYIIIGVLCLIIMGGLIYNRMRETREILNKINTSLYSINVFIEASRREAKEWSVDVERNTIRLMTMVEKFINGANK
jgi:hypothetical protein